MFQLEKVKRVFSVYIELDISPYDLCKKIAVVTYNWVTTAIFKLNVVHILQTPTAYYLETTNSH